MSDSSSSRDPATNAGSDSARHYQGGTAHEQHARTPARATATPSRQVGESIVHDRPPGNSVAGSVVRDR